MEQETVTTATPTSRALRGIFRKGVKHRIDCPLVGSIDDMALPEDQAQHSIAHDCEDEKVGLLGDLQSTDLRIINHNSPHNAKN